MLLGPILILLTFAAGGLFWLRPAWFPVPITAEAFAFDRQFGSTLAICALLFVAAHLLLAYVVLKKALKKALRKALGKTRRAAPSASVTAVEFTWTILTAALFLALSFTGSRNWATAGDRTPGAETIEVYAHQFAWNFRYPGPDNRFGVTTASLINDAGGNPLGIDPADKAGRDDIVAATLRIPAGRDILLLLHSRDVIHDFFVRELRTKQDIVPGMEIPLRIHAERTGRFEIACAELCGLGHSQMRSLLIVMPAADYDIWKHAQQPHR